MMDVQRYLEARHRQVEDIIAKTKDHRIAGWGGTVVLAGIVGIALFSLTTDRQVAPLDVFFWSLMVGLAFYFLAYATFQQSRRRDAQAELRYLHAMRTEQAKFS